MTPKEKKAMSAVKDLVSEVDERQDKQIKTLTAALTELTNTVEGSVKYSSDMLKAVSTESKRLEELIEKLFVRLSNLETEGEKTPKPHKTKKE